MFRFFPILAIVLSLFTLFAGAKELVQLTNYSGKSIRCMIIQADDSEVKVKVPSKSRVYTLPLESLDLASKEKIQDWVDSGAGLSKKLLIRFQSGKSNRVSKREAYDDRALRLRPFATILNEDRKVRTNELTVTFSLVGRPVLDKSLYYVFSKDQRDLGVIEEGGQVRVEFSQVSTEYDDRGYAQYGHMYVGYTMVIQDKNGEVIATKSVPSSLIGKGVENVLKLAQGRYYSKSLSEVSGVNY